MTPYGIVYTDNVLSLNESKKQWLKKEKIINKGYFILGYLIIVLLIFAANLCIYLLTKEKDTGKYMAIMPLELIFSFILLYLGIKKEKESAYVNSCFSKERKQVVLKENSAVFTADYRQTEYFYDEIEGIVETENTVTVFIDSHYSYPIYISKNSIEKGSAEFFCNILKEKTADKYSVL